MKKTMFKLNKKEISNVWGGNKEMLESIRDFSKEVAKGALFPIIGAILL
jgi:hypothetical protein